MGADEFGARELVGKCDLVTAFDSIHDLTNPSAALEGAHSLLKPLSGVFAMVSPSLTHKHTHIHTHIHIHTHTHTNKLTEAYPGGLS